MTNRGADGVDPAEMPREPILLVPGDFQTIADPSAAAEEVVPPPPVVIVEYRTRWSTTLLPPAMILAATVLFVAYRPDLDSTPPAVSAPLAGGEARIGPPADTPGPSTQPETAPLVVKVEPILPVDEPIATAPVVAVEEAAARPLPAPDADAGAGALAAVDPVDPEAKPAAAPEPPPGGLFAGPLDIPEPDVEEVTREALKDIDREAEERRAERLEMIAARAHRGRVGRERDALAAEARGKLVEVNRRHNEEMRAEFREELRRVLQTWGERSGPKILALAERYHVEPGPGVEQAIAKDLRGRTGRENRIRRIQMLRSHGLPEPLVLGDLMLLEIRQQGSRRSGVNPNNRVHAMGMPDVNFQAAVRAARQLLAVPPITRTAAGPGLAVGLRPQ